MVLAGVNKNGPVNLNFPSTSSTLATCTINCALGASAAARVSSFFALSDGIFLPQSQHSPSPLTGSTPQRTVCFLGPTSRWTAYSKKLVCTVSVGGVGRMRKLLSPSFSLNQDDC